MKNKIKRVDLVELKASNFKGLKNVSIVFDKNITNVLGKNESGKTSLSDAFAWLTTGKTYGDVEKFPIKPLDENGQVINELLVSVECAFDIYEQDLITLEESTKERLVVKKEFQEKWGAERKGSSNRVLKSNTINHFWNNAPIKTETEFNSRMLELIGDSEVFKLLTNPLYFSSDPKSKSWGWKNRRELLEKVANVNLSDEWVLTKNPDLQNLVDSLKTKSLSDIVNEANYNKAGIKKEIDSLNTRVDENMLQKVDPVDEEGINEKIYVIEKKIEEIDQILSDKSKLNEEKNKKKIALQNEMHDALIRNNDIENAEKLAYQTENSNANSVIESIKKGLEERKIRLSNGKEFLESLKKQLKTKESDLGVFVSSKEAEIADLRIEFQAINSQSFILDDSHKFCKDPLCGKEYDHEHVAAKGAELLKDFNEKREARKKEINDLGVRLVKSIEDSKNLFSAESDKINQDLDKYSEIVSKLQSEVNEMELALENVDKQGVEDIKSLDDRLLSNTEYQSGLKKIEDLKILLNKDQNEDNTADESVDVKKSLQEELKALNSELDKNVNNEKIDARINELKEKARSLGEDLSNLDKVGFDALEYERIKYEELENKVNSMFKYAKFKMFNKLQNGGFEPTCIVMYKGKPFVEGGLNTAGKYFAGIDIIDVLSDYYGIALPIFIDNRESVTDIPDTKLQIVNLKVDSSVEKLSYYKGEELVRC